jgi:hypothetical protein
VVFGKSSSWKKASGMMNGDMIKMDNVEDAK